MGKYLKMSSHFVGNVSINADGQICDDKYFRGSTDIAEDYYDPICHAINSHDELVAEVERLRCENEALMKCRMAAREFFNSTVASGGSVKVSSTSKTALDEADKASGWLEAELKATADLVNK